MAHWLGVDTGGTFTDFVYFDGRQVRIHKVLSTPDAPERAILQGIDEMQVSCAGLHLVHGSTVATNALLERKGVKTLYVTNQGFTDVLTIGRQARRALYELMPRPSLPLVDASCCLGVDTRTDATGRRLRELQSQDIERLLDEIAGLSPKAVAINLLFSFLDPQPEQQLKIAIQQRFPELFVCCSSDVLAEHREYERGMATTLNAYVGPLMQGYLQRLQQQLDMRVATGEQLESAGDPAASVSLAVMQSSGGTVDAARAGQHAVSLLLSGPAGGLKGAQYVAALSDNTRLLSFDMGGTSTDVALIDERIRLTTEALLGGFPVAVPMVDMHTIGAGGGSIAWLDAGGLLNVGPESAGASPGPACYANGGMQPTVTDANLLLGRLRADGFLGKGMSLDIEAARDVMQPVADSLGVSIEEAALGVIEVANEHMVRALRTISVQRGYDPQAFTLACFGGAGGLHVCALAEAMSMTRAIVPVHGGVLSALGMLVSSPKRELSHTSIQLLQDADPQQLEQAFLQIQQQGFEEMRAELADDELRVQRSMDLRYRGQSFTLNIDVQTIHDDELKAVQQSFHDRHRASYGHALDIEIELVNLRVSLAGHAPPFALPEIQQQVAMPDIQQVQCYGYDQPIRCYQREQLGAGYQLQGPALVLEKVSTTLIDKGWLARVDKVGNLCLQKQSV